MINHGGGEPRSTAGALGSLGHQKNIPTFCMDSSLQSWEVFTFILCLTLLFGSPTPYFNTPPHTPYLS